MEVGLPSTGELYQMWGNNPIAIMQQQKQIDLGNMFANQTYQKNQQTMQQDAAMNPLKVRQAELGNLTSEAQLPGVQADSRVKGVNANIAEATQNEAISTKMKELAKMASDSDLSLIENQGRVLAMSQDPKQRDLGLQMVRMHKDLIKYRDEASISHKNRLGEIAAQGAEARALEGMRINAGKYTRSGMVKGIQDALAKAKTYQQASLILEQAATEAELAGDAEAARSLIQRANAFKTADLERQTAAAGARAATAPDLNQMGIPTNPVPAPSQFGGQQNPYQQQADPNLAKLPQGTQALGNGVYQLPDGRKVRAKQ